MENYAPSFLRAFCVVGVLLFMVMTRIEVEKVQPLWKSIGTPPANDKRLSFKARGILYYLYMKPDDWKGQLYDLQQNSEEDGIKSIQSGLKELVKFGYAELVPEINETGQFIGKYYKIFLLSKNKESH